MMDKIEVKKSRFRDASWFEKIDKFNVPVIIGGAGGIGSWLTLFLARMLPSTGYIFLYDFDEVEEVNMAGQLFGKEHLRMPKVQAVYDVVSRFSDYERMSLQNMKYTSESLRSPVMFSAFDNMQARKDMFQNWKKEEKLHDLGKIFIDGRLLAEQLQVFFVTPETEERYEKEYLFDDSEVQAENCSYKQTSHFAAIIAAKMIQGFTNWLVKDQAELPFYYEEIGGLFLTKAEN
jgi:molybdopterin/thiamine biosynthesis adenylyltransferase